MNVLILEDNERTRNKLMEVTKACNGVDRVFSFGRKEDAYFCAMEHVINLFLVDIVLEPEKDNDNSGILFADSLRRHNSYKLTPIIFITGLMGLERDLLKRVHCYDYIEKPIGDGRILKEHLDEVVEAVLAGKQPERKEYVPLRHDGIGYMVYLDDVVYFNNKQGTLYIHTIDDEIVIPNLSTKTFMNKIQDDCFLMPTHGTAVNVKYIENIDFRNREVYLKHTDFAIPIGGRKYKQFKEDYMRWQTW